MSSSSAKILIAVFAVLAVSACHPRRQTSSSPQAGTAAVAATSGTALPDDHATTQRYRIALTLPSLPADEAPLSKALRSTADRAKRKFLKALPDPQQFPEFAHRQLQLRLDFSIAAQTSAFTSIRETGSEDTGGAHPIPVQSSFVYDRSAGRLIVLNDLFTNPAAARKGLATYAREKLRKRFMAQAPGSGEGSPEAIREWKTNMLQMLDEGTRPSADNYTVFIVRAGARETDPSPGLMLIFPPYQVAPYVYGTQTVKVPAEVFAKLLKPRYRKAFAAN